MTNLKLTGKTTLKQLNDFYTSRGFDVYVEKIGENKYTSYTKFRRDCETPHKEIISRRIMEDLKRVLNFKPFSTNKSVVQLCEERYNEIQCFWW